MMEQDTIKIYINVILRDFRRRLAINETKPPEMLNGICLLLTRYSITNGYVADRIMDKIFDKWPEASGNKYWPVAGYNDSGNGSRWDSPEYGAKRRRLLDYCIEQTSFETMTTFQRLHMIRAMNMVNWQWMSFQKSGICRAFEMTGGQDFTLYELFDAWPESTGEPLAPVGGLNEYVEEANAGAIWANDRRIALLEWMINEYGKGREDVETLNCGAAYKTFMSGEISAAKDEGTS